MARTVTITYIDHRFTDLVEQSDCVEMTELFISEGVLDLRVPHIVDMMVAVE
jgi:hypothetical protein